MSHDQCTRPKSSSPVTPQGGRLRDECRADRRPPDEQLRVHQRRKRPGGDGAIREVDRPGSEGAARPHDPGAEVDEHRAAEQPDHERKGAR